MDETAVCSRCGRKVSIDSDEYIEWEVIAGRHLLARLYPRDESLDLLESEDRMICPGCLTGYEQRLIDEEMDAVEKELFPPES